MLYAGQHDLKLCAGILGRTSVAWRRMSSHPERFLLDFFFRFDVFFFGTFLSFLRAFDRPIAIACLRLFTRPPRPPRPLSAVPF
jgi:hypothetical protein